MSLDLSKYEISASPGKRKWLNLSDYEVPTSVDYRLDSMIDEEQPALSTAVVDPVPEPVPSTIGEGLKYGLKSGYGGTLIRAANVASALSPIGAASAPAVRAKGRSELPTEELTGVPAKVAAGISQFAIDLPQIIAASAAGGPLVGLPAFSAASVDPDQPEPLKALGTETAKGALLAAALGPLGRLPLAGRAVGGAGIFGGMTAAEGGNTEDVVSQLLIGAGLGTMGGKKKPVKSEAKPQVLPGINAPRGDLPLPGINVPKTERFGPVKGGKVVKPTVSPVKHKPVSVSQKPKSEGQKGRWGEISPLKIEEEQFTYGTRNWDIQKAKQIIQDSPRNVEIFDVEGGKYFIKHGLIQVKKSISEKADLSAPLIAMQGKDGQWMVIDGWHRIKKALDSGVKELPMYKLTESESILVEGGKRPAPKKGTVVPEKGSQPVTSKVETGKGAGKTIEDIVTAARRPMMDVTKVIRLKGTDGKWHNASGFPVGVKSTGESKVIGYAGSRNGIKYGKIEPTKEALIERMTKTQERADNQFREELNKMSSKRLREQTAYWLKDKQKTAPPIKKTISKPPSKKKVKPKTTRQPRKLMSPQQISDFRPGIDKVVRRNGKTFIEGKDYAPQQVVSDAITPAVEANLRKLPQNKLAQYRQETANSPYLSPEGRAERLAILDDMMAKPTSTELGAAGASAKSMSSAKTDARMEPPGQKRPVSRQQIVDVMRDKFKIPFRVGKFKERAVGIYKIRPEVVRTRVANEIGVISHELGHHLEKKVYGGFGRQSQLKPGPIAKKDLIRLGKELYGEKRPKGGYGSEGFAEYISYWLTTEKAGKFAPNFHKYFESRFLKNNPEIAKNMAEVRTLAREYYNQGAVARVQSNIGANRPTLSRIKEKAKDAALRINTLLADDLAPLEFVEKKIRGVSKLDPRKIDPMTSPTILARAHARTASSKARSMVLDGTFDKAGKKTGDSMRDVLAPAVKDLDQAMTYSYAKRALEVHKQGKDPGITRADAQYVVDNIADAGRRKVYDGVHKGLTAFENRVMEYLVDAGGMSKDAAKIIMELNPAHIPLKRAIEGSFVGGGRKMADVSSPVKRLKGSGLPIRNPYESIIENTVAIINFADKVRVGRALVELSGKEGAGKWIEKIPAPQEAKRFSLESMEKQLKEAGVDLSEANMEQVLTVYSNAGVYKGRDNIVSFWRGGEREFYQVDKRLYATLKAMDEINLPPAVDFLFGRPARAIRLGATGLNAGFGLITNPLRDAFTFGLQTEFTRGTPELIGRSLVKKMFKPSNEMNTLFKRSGADMSQFLGMDRKQLKKAMSEATATTATRKTWNIVSHPIEAMKDVFSITEASPRLAEFEAAYKAGEKLYGKGSAQAQVMANLASSDVTVNFRRAGAYGKYINQIVPFWNAQVQGVLKFGRFAKAHPSKAAIKAVAGLTVPTIGIWMLNKDEEWYRNSPPWLRYGFWNIPVGENKDGSPAIVRIPRPFEWGVVFAGTPEMVLDYWHSKDPAVAKDGLSYMAEQTIPIGAGHIPATAKIIIEQWANYDFFRERDIVPFYEAKYKEPEDQFSKYTTETSKFIGRQFGLSPRKIDHLISSSTGGLGRDITKATEKMLGFGKAESDHPANMPVIGRLFARTQTPEQIEKQLYYVRNDRLQQIKNKIKAGKKGEAKKMIAEWNRLNAGKQYLHNGYKQSAAMPLYKYLLAQVQGKSGHAKR